MNLNSKIRDFSDMEGLFLIAELLLWVYNEHLLLASCCRLKEAVHILL